MTYVLGDVAVKISDRAVRPREPARPGVRLTLKSPEMALRAPRPRGVPPRTVQSQLTQALLKNVAVFKAKQAVLEKTLPTLGKQLAAVKAAGESALRAGNRAVHENSKQASVVLEKNIDKIIQAIKVLAAKANDAAAGAIQNGANRAQVLAVSNAAKGYVTQQIAKPVKMVKKAAAIAKKHRRPAPAPRVFFEAPRAAQPATEPAVETSTATVTPSGQIVPGPDAKVVDTPVLTESGKFAPLDVGVTASSGSLATFAVVGVLGWFGYKFLKKRGIV